MGNSKKEFTVRFNKEIQKQNMALKILELENIRTGIPYLYIIHDALYEYGKIKGYIDKRNKEITQNEDGEQAAPTKATLPLSQYDDYSDMI